MLRHVGHGASRATPSRASQAGGEHAAAARAAFQVVRDQQRQGREHRQDVAGQLGVRLGEEQDDEGGPDQQHQARAGSAPGCAARVRAQRTALCTSTPSQGTMPAASSTKKHVPGGFAVVLRLEEAVQVFVDEEEVRLLRDSSGRPARTRARRSAKNSSRPLTRCRRRPDPPVRATAGCRAPARRPAAPGRSGPWPAPPAPCRPSTPASSCAFSLALAPSRWASSRAHRTMVIMPDKPMSSESIWLQATQ